MKWLGALVMLALASFGPTVAATQAAFPDEATLRSRFSMPPDTKLLYRDAEGKSVDAKTFLDRINAGNGFVFKPVNADGFVVLTLDKPPRKPRGPLGDLVIGERIPAFSLTSSTGRQVTSDRFDHDVTVVDFFFFDCTGCIEEIPALNAFHAAHPDIGAMSITFDAAAELAAFKKKFGLTWEIVPDAVSFYDKANIQIFPTLGIVDRHGKLLDLKGGWTLHPSDRSLTGEDIARWVAKVRSSAPVRGAAATP
jgi:peroxiredoxin